MELDTGNYLIFIIHFVPTNLSQYNWYFETDLAMHMQTVNSVDKIIHLTDKQRSFTL